MKPTDDAARYSKVTRRMWNDEGFRKLSSPKEPSAQFLWLRLLTGPELGIIPGCFQAWDGGIARALGWPVEGTLNAFQEIVDQGMAEADWSVGFVFVPKAIKHNRPNSANVVKSWKKAWVELPECLLKDKAHQALKGFLKEVGKGYVQAFAEGCQTSTPNQEQDQEQEQEQEQEIDPQTPSGTKRAEREAQARKVFGYWQDLFEHQQASYDAKRRQRILARLDEGKTVEQLCSALRGAKHDHWLMGKDPKNPRVYDGLETLLRDAGQVERLMGLDATAKPTATTVGPKTPVPRKVDPDEEILAQRTRERLAQVRANATPEELLAAEGLAGAVTKLVGNLFKP